MDAHDLLRQLTRGAKFTKRRKEDVQKTDINETNETEIKDEPCNNHSSESDEEPEQTEFRFLKSTDFEEPPKKKNKKIKLTVKERDQKAKDEMISTMRRENNIKIYGKNIPAPISAFEELATSYNVHEQLVNNLLTCNYPQPTPIQMQAIPILLQGRPLMACAPTGSGKTIAFLAPIINDLRCPQKKGFRAIVLAPTRELAQQIYRECVRLAEKTALRIHIINKVSQAKQKFGPNGNKKFDILISTPNRVRYLLQQEPPLLDLASIEWFVIDEADRLMEEGQNSFKEQLDDIMLACSNPNKKIALFSATYTVPVAKWALKNLKNLARVTVGQQNAATESVEQELLFVGSEQGKLLAIRDMVRTGLKPPVLVFVQSKERAKQLFQELLYDGINVDVIHAERTQQQRDNCVRAFREGHIWVLICTELMGRGIDFKGVNLVINYDFPPSTIAYVHRIGRAGRAGRTGKAITFFTQNDTPQLRSIAQIIKNSGGKVPEFMLTMKKPRKSDLKRLENIAPKREDISTKIKPETINLESGWKNQGKQNINNAEISKTQKPNKNPVKKLNSSKDRQGNFKKVEKSITKNKPKHLEKLSKIRKDTQENAKN